MEGILFNIQKYVLHDGPGIRTTVFLKGCPLTCLWCHNPESINPMPETVFNNNKCVSCTEACSNDNVDGCPAEAAELIGKVYTSDQVMEAILKDRVFYEESGGGVTFSGGEPFMQAEFLHELVIKCKAEDIHVTVDTSACFNFEKIKPMLAYIDLCLVDLKSMDDKVHRKVTGVSNKVILDNIRKLAKYVSVYIRLPLIKDLNDTASQVGPALDFACQVGAKQVNLLPYHRLGTDKIRNLGQLQGPYKFEAPTSERMNEIVRRGRQKNMKVIIGG